MIASTLFRLAGLAAIVAGISYVIVGVFHPANVLASVTTPAWSIVHIFALALCFFGSFGLTGLYTRQASESGWLGLIGYLMLSLWLAMVMGFTFIEVFVLPILATASPAFVESFVGMFTGSPSTIDLGALPTLWLISSPLYLLGGIVFGIATFRARVFPRWAALLLAVGTAAGPAAILFPPDYVGVVAVPVGVALAWLGWALWSEKADAGRDVRPPTL